MLANVAAIEGRFLQEGTIWTDSQTPGTLEDRCPDRKIAMERMTASVRPQESDPGNDPDSTPKPCREAAMLSTKPGHGQARRASPTRTAPGLQRRMAVATRGLPSFGDGVTPRTRASTL